ncbi:DUF3164 family protein [Undibacterium sp. 14-3-2]|jgi:hypothetical protein|uniref:DUF3164 family protein n=1 Tax=Undibacterium sp. 14-3-2 TaxID=2800129 RepID=UPI001903A8A1|nr:DUF3164 family protein [Undibacterium sp. 14-3-2]MBK1890701.1 DUF3164 family protein [Undibacterium sp. 14-3-2]
MSKNNAMPGFMLNAVGHYVPESMVEPIDKQRDQLVKELLSKATDVKSALVEFKNSAFADIAAFIELSAEEYNTKVGGKKGNVTLYSFDGQYKVQFAVAEKIKFDERLQVAKNLIDECIKAWSEGSSPEIQVLVQSAFETDKEGNLNHGRILSLRRYAIKDERWQRAMLAISESIQVVGSKQYVRFYQRREGTDQYDAISLDFASV